MTVEDNYSETPAQ